MRRNATRRLLLAWIKTQRVEKRAVEAVHGQLAERGYRYLHLLERDSDMGCRLHLFLVDDEALPFVAKITNGASNPGDPLGFDPTSTCAVGCRLSLVRRVARLPLQHR